ncbi:Thymidylate kinase [Usitatibacter rugosus]|uniref:Thymidylate kinase n=1 Tax=Usitatibacter rugosus TaxID=2732067 RepID=A0A6M4GUX7_9PROT|nr:dTMP kinase [Usitatibacter rugosus]QJR11120.1 Thymidylate kinase [Usitatibacter rugosus]
MRGRFITLEGIDGAGKSSHVQFIADQVRERGVHVIDTREPGGTRVGEDVRKIVLHEPMGVRAEAYLMFGARSEHVTKVIEPALAAGEWVICDRFIDSTYAYQCGGHGLPRATFDALVKALEPAPVPDATFLFDVDPALAAERQQGQQRTPDRFEREKTDFFRRVRGAYLERARDEPARIRVIDASGSFEQVRARLEAALAPVLA